MKPSPTVKLILYLSDTRNAKSSTRMAHADSARAHTAARSIKLSMPSAAGRGRS